MYCFPCDTLSIGISHKISMNRKSIKGIVVTTSINNMRFGSLLFLFASVVTCSQPVSAILKTDLSPVESDSTSQEEKSYIVKFNSSDSYASFMIEEPYVLNVTSSLPTINAQVMTFASEKEVRNWVDSREDIDYYEESKWRECSQIPLVESSQMLCNLITFFCFYHLRRTSPGSSRISTIRYHHGSSFRSS